MNDNAPIKDNKANQTQENNNGRVMSDNNTPITPTLAQTMQRAISTVERITSSLNKDEHHIRQQLLDIRRDKIAFHRVQREFLRNMDRLQSRYDQKERMKSRCRHGGLRLIKVIGKLRSICLLQVRLLKQRRRVHRRHHRTTKMENALYHRLQDLRRKRQGLLSHWIRLGKSVDSGTLSLGDFSWLEDVHEGVEGERDI
jgi:hypothetical protein